MIIAIETATPAVSVALADSTGVVATFALQRGRRHVETLVPVVEQLLQHAEATYADVRGIAVDIGPGLFTGLRVGVATAKALALALGVPLFAAPSLAILANEYASGQVVDRVGTEVLAVLDARRKEVYAQRFRVEAGTAVALGEPVCAPLAVVAGSTGLHCAVVVGDVAVSAHAFRDRTVVAGFPVASRLVQMVPRLGVVDPDGLELLYLRAPDAEISWSKRP